MRGGFRRVVMSVGVLVLVLVGAGYAWTGTPSYSLYRIRRALLTHDYSTFSYYVDVDSVLDHGFKEFANEKPQEEASPQPRGPLGKLLKKGFLKGLMGNAGDMMKAGLSIAVEQAVRDPERPLPEIPFFAVIAALWNGHAEADVIRFPIKVKKDAMIEVKTQKNPAGVWRVVEVDNLPSLLPILKHHHRGKHAQPADQ
jgi:hypothetical protein